VRVRVRVRVEGEGGEEEGGGEMGLCPRRGEKGCR